MPHGVIFHIGGFQGYAHMANEIIVFVFLECSFTLNSVIYVSSAASYLHVYTLEVLSEIVTV